MSVTLKLEDEIDLSRGDMLVSQHDRPNVSQKFAAMLVWMHAQPLEIGRSYVLKHCGRKVRGRVTRVRHRVNIDTLNPEAAEQLNMNDIAAVELETNQALFFDSYELNRITGSLILIDPLTNATLGAGMIREDLSEVGARLPSQETLHSESAVTPLERHRRHGHSAAIILVNAGTALVRGLERALFDDGFEVMLVERNASTNSATAGWRMLHSAGFVVVYQNSSLGIEERLDLRAAAGDSFFDLAGLSPLQSDAEIIEQVRALAESLRIPRGTENAGEVV
jgi:hypothetical protein